MLNKKELLEVALMVMLGIVFLLLLAFNVKQYDKKFPTQQVNQIESF